MNKKTIILCLSILAGMIVLVGVAVAFLYSDNGGGDSDEKVEISDDLALMSLVPSDAVLVANFGSSGKNIPVFEYSVQNVQRAAVSLHYAGSLVPLYAFDMGRAGEDMSEQAASLIEEVRSKGHFAEYINGKTQAGLRGAATKREIVLASPSDVVLKSSLRHIDKGVSILDINAFPEAVRVCASSELLVVSNSQAAKIASAVFKQKKKSGTEFVSCLSDWTGFALGYDPDSGLTLSGKSVSDALESDFLKEFAACEPAVSSVAAVLPNYTVSAVSLPLKDIDKYLAAYESYMDSRQKLAAYHDKLKSLGKARGIQPDAYFRKLKTTEIAVASFRCGDKMEKVNLVRTGDCDIKAGEVQEYAYSGFAAALFGSLFSLADESCCCLCNGWLISGSRAAVGEYVSGRALEYTLKAFMSDNSKLSLSAAPASFLLYASMTRIDRDDFTKSASGLVGKMTGDAGYSPLIFTVGKKMQYNLIWQNSEIRKAKAPKFERDTVVVVSKGPFEVKNSGTGKTNKFYQQPNNYLCLSENGKSLWAAEFATPICGTAENIDYFGNGKLQIIFGSTTKIHAIDRLGRMVSGFPIDLKKEILLGPSVYDFSGNKKYNVMVLHKDNTIAMYNLKGAKPANWKDITARETIKALPERIEVGGNTFWVVRTSLQTLIFPFMGGESLTDFSGDRMIRPDSVVKVIDNETVEVTSYDGRQKSVRLK